MPTYEVEMNGQKFSIDAPDDASVNLAVKQMHEQAPPTADPAVPPQAGGYSSAPSWTQPITAFGRGAADVATGGFLDEAGAAADYAGSHILPWRQPKTFDQALQDTRGDDQALAAQNPVSTIAGDVAGGVGLGTGLAKAGLSFAAATPANAALTNVIARGIADAGITSGIYGFGSGQGWQNRAEKGAIGATIGGLIGGGIPLVARGVSGAYNAIADQLAKAGAAGKAGTTPGVVDILSDTLGADGSLGAQGQANMAKAGSEAMFADAGPNAKKVLDTAIQRGGPGSVEATQAIEGRVNRGAQDLTTVLDDTLGAPEGVFTARKDIATAAKPAIGDAYKTAYETPIDYADPRGQALEQLVSQRVPGDIIANANKLMRLNGESSKQILADIADDGSVTYKTLPDVRQLDYITRALKQASESGEGQGALGGQTQLGAAYQNLSRNIRSGLRDLVPEYGNALDTAADPISRSQAVKLGGQALSPSVRTDEFANSVEGMSVAEKAGLGQGIRSDIEHRVSNVTRSLQDGNMDAREAVKSLRDLSSRASREKVTLAIGDEKASKLFDEIDRISTTFDLRASVAENSKTFARQATEGRINSMTAPGPIATLAQGKPLNAAQKLAQVLTRQTPDAVNARQQKIYSDIAQFLTRPADQALPAFQAMQNYGGQTLANRARAGAIAQVLSGAQPLAYPSSALLGKKARE